MSSIPEKLAAGRAVAKYVGDIYAAALQAAELCVSHGIPFPDEVSRLLTVPTPRGNRPSEPTGEKVQQRRSLGAIPPPYPIFKPEWISLPVADAQLATVIALVLGNEVRPITKDAIKERARLIDPTVREAALYGVWGRLAADGVIGGVDDDAVFLCHPDEAPSVVDGRVWGPPKVFATQEVAVHRREAILSALKVYGPLWKSDLAEALKATDWVHASLVDSLIANDLKCLHGAGKIRRPSGSERDFRWELAEAVEASEQTVDASQKRFRLV